MQEKDTAIVIIRKCRCNQVHCKDCMKRQFGIFQARLKQFNWQRTRMITTTVSREYGNQEEIYNLTRKKPSYLLQDIKRFLYRNFNRYVTVLEWQTGGYAHYHIMVEFNRIGMIGKHEIQRLWGYGNCWEDYFETEKDFLEIAGYFGKLGYFEKHHEKEHQITPPDFILKNYKDVKKFTYSRNDDWLYSREVGIPTGRKGHEIINKKTVGERIDSCGKSIIVDILINGKLIQNKIIPVEYKEIKNNEKLKYQDKVGLIGKLKIKELTELIACDRNRISKLDSEQIIERVWKGFINAIREFDKI